jgi:hypothetical protein
VNAEGRGENRCALNFGLLVSQHPYSAKPSHGSMPNCCAKAPATAPGVSAKSSGKNQLGRRQ